MAVTAVVANATGAAVTAGLNTVPNRAVAVVTLAAGDADTFLTAGCAVAAAVSGKSQEAVYLLHRNPGAA
jgi:hypothetical protein